MGRVIDGTTATVAHAWLVYPLVAACAVAALVLHSGRLAVVAAALVASIAAAFALAVAQAPMPGLVGLWVTCLGAVITLVSLSFLIPTGSHLSAAVTLEQSRHGSLRIRP